MIFFTSDEHYGHRNIIEYCNRPFASVAAMTDDLIARHNARVAPGDVVYHLGDFAMDARLIPGILKRLNGEHHLVAGNHDKCYPTHGKHVRHTREYLQYGFASVQRQVFFCGVGGRLSSGMIASFLLDHMPYAADERHDTRYAEWRPKDEGEWLLHGHVHGLWKTRERMINVGVDVWDYAPVSYEELLALREEPW